MGVKVNSFLISFAIITTVIFGGVFTIRYFRTGELLLDQFIGAIVGVILLGATLIWRKAKKSC